MEVMHKAMHHHDAKGLTIVHIAGMAILADSAAASGAARTLLDDDDRRREGGDWNREREGNWGWGGDRNGWGGDRREGGW